MLPLVRQSYSLKSKVPRLLALIDIALMEDEVICSPFAEEKELLMNDRCPHYVLSTLQHTKCFKSFTLSLAIPTHGILAEILPIWTTLLRSDIFHECTFVEIFCRTILVASKPRA